MNFSKLVMSRERFTIRGIDDFELISYASDILTTAVILTVRSMRDESVQCFSFHLSICDCLCMLIIV